MNRKGFKIFISLIIAVVIGLLSLSIYEYKQVLDVEDAYLFDGYWLDDYSLNSPGVMVQDSSGNIYLTDEDHPDDSDVMHTLVIKSTPRALSHTSWWPWRYFNSLSNSPELDKDISIKDAVIADDSSVYVIFGSYEDEWAQIERFDKDGRVQKMWNTHSAAGGESESLMNADSIAVDSRKFVYVTDHLSHNIIKFDSYGTLLKKWGDHGDGPGEFDFVDEKSGNGIAVDRDGFIYVCDTGNNRIQKFDHDGNFILEFGSKGRGIGEFRNPVDVVIGPDDDIYVIDQGNDRIQIFSPDGKWAGMWGNKSSSVGNFSNPEFLMFDSSGIAYVIDDRKIKRFVRMKEDVGEAVAYDDELSETSPGLSLLSSFDYKEAVVHFTKAVESDPEDFDAYNNRGIAHAGLSNYEEAKKDFEKSASINPYSAYPLINLGAVFIAHGNSLESERMHLKDASLHNNRAEPLYFAADRDSARTFRVPSADILTVNHISDEHGIIHGKKVSYQLAERYLTKAIDQDTSLAGGYINRGALYIILGGLEKAARDLDAAIRIEPGLADLYMLRAMAHNLLGNYKEAVHDLEKVMSLDPDYPGIYYRSGIAHYNRGYFRKAEENLREAIDRDPDNEYARLQLLVVSQKLVVEKYNMYKDELKDYLESSHSRGWVRSLSEYFLGINNMTASEILILIEYQGNSLLKNEMRCEAFYYFAEKEMMEGNREQAPRLFSKSIGTNVYYFHEYSSAKAMMQLLSSGRF